jgi:hypothetical protein
MGMEIFTIWVMKWTLLLLAPLSTMDRASSWCALFHSGACKILEGL